MSNFLNLLYSWLYYHYIALLITIIFTCVLACNSMFSISILFFSFWLYETACGTFLIRDQTCNLYSGLDHSTTREAPVLPLLCLTSFSWDGCTRIFACWCLFRMFPVWTSYWICLVTQSCLTLCDPVDCVAQQGPLLHWDSWGKNIGASHYALLQGIFPTQGSNEPRFPTLQADSLLSEPRGKPENSGVGCHALLQGIFPTKELNQGLLLCRQILYQLSYQGILAVIEYSSSDHSHASISACIFTFLG